MKKVIVTGIVLIIFGVYAIFYHKSSAALPITAKENASSAPSLAAKATTVPTTSQTSGGRKDGDYTGATADAFYGSLQVKATISGGKLTDVQFLQYPNDKHESVEINQNAMPLLKQEAIKAQDAKVDVVSGATQTSQAFNESLASALSQAK